MFWLRNSPHKYYANETEAAKALREEFGLRRVYPADLFYATHKISQADFLQKLREADEPNALINALYEDESKSGRRGVLPLS